MIEVRGLTKRFGRTVAVDGLSFTVPPGRVTGFLGPNGAGKSTTMRMIVNLDLPDAGEALVKGQPYRELRHPLRTVGALLDARWTHPRRSARDHLRWLARSNHIPARRVDEVLERVGLAGVARKSTGGFSLGMAQRLGIAAALLGDPEILLLDEPINGLDPEGIHWVRLLVRELADDGRTVLISSHLLSEMALTADHLVVIGRGRLIADSPVAEFVTGTDRPRVRVRSPHPERLLAALTAAGFEVEAGGAGVLSVTGATTEQVGQLAADHSVVLHELAAQTASLEQAYIARTTEAVDYRAAAVEGAVAEKEEQPA
jgi:ABC-2 type transport system ATP-binding protein